MLVMQATARALGAGERVKRKPKSSPRVHRPRLVAPRRAPLQKLPHRTTLFEFWRSLPEPSAVMSCVAGSVNRASGCVS
jgi:hypothetical protein